MLYVYWTTVRLSYTMESFETYCKNWWVWNWMDLYSGDGVAALSLSLSLSPSFLSLPPLICSLTHPVYSLFTPQLLPSTDPVTPNLYHTLIVWEVERASRFQPDICRHMCLPSRGPPGGTDWVCAGSGNVEKSWNFEWIILGLEEVIPGMERSWNLLNLHKVMGNSWNFEIEVSSIFLCVCVCACDSINEWFEV